MRYIRILKNGLETHSELTYRIGSRFGTCPDGGNCIQMSDRVARLFLVHIRNGKRDNAIMNKIEEVGSQ